MRKENRAEEDQRGVTPADWVLGPSQGSWTYETYAALPEDGKRYEMVQGVLMMSPAPGSAHQGIRGKMYRYLCSRILDTERGLVFTAPFDVVLSRDTTVQPDVVVVLKEHLGRVQERGFFGVPDLVVEVISPRSATFDRFVKYHVYEQAGVPEYWLVNKRMKMLEIFILEAGKYRSLGVFRGEQLPVSRLVPDMTITVGEFFDWTHGFR